MSDQTYLPVPNPKLNTHYRKRTDDGPFASPIDRSEPHSEMLGYAWRFAIFLALELGYLSLATVCVVHPIALPASFNAEQTAVKGGITILFIAWQTLALLPIANILSKIFSSEWSYLHNRTGELDDGKTDRVSVLTASVIDHASHAVFTSSASLTFRAAFAVFLCSVALHNFAPGVISISPTFVDIPTTLSIGNFTVNGQWSSEVDGSVTPAMLASGRATAIIRLEQIENSSFGFSTDPSNCIVGWPSTSFLPNGTEVTYRSDSACWSHKCEWKPANTNYANPSNLYPLGIPNDWWNAEGDTDNAWQNYVVYVPALARSGIFPLYALSYNTHSALYNGTGQSAFLFFGGNTTLNNGTLGDGIDLSGIPAYYNSTGYPLHVGENSTDDGGLETGSHLYSMLICDPQLSIAPATVTLNSTGTLSISRSSSGDNPVGNLPHAMGAVITSQGLLSSIALIDQGGGNSQIASSLTSDAVFMTKSTPAWPMTSFDNPNGSASIPVNSLDTINANMDRFMSSAAKAYANGYVEPGNFSEMSVPGTMKVERLTLTASKPLWIVTIALVVVVCLILLAALSQSGPGRVPFNLENVRRALSEQPKAG